MSPRTLLTLLATGCAADPLEGPWDCTRLGEDAWPLFAEEVDNADGSEAVYQSFRAMRLHVNPDLSGFTLTDERYLTFYDGEQVGEQLGGRAEHFFAQTESAGQYTLNPSGPDERVACALEGDFLDCERIREGERGDEVVYTLRFSRASAEGWPW